MEFACKTDTGRLRSHNEDALFADASASLFIVSDGMGGMNAGEVASKTVVEALSGLIKKNLEAYASMSVTDIEEHVRQSLKDLSGHIRSETENQFGLSGMGATVVMALVHNNTAIIASVGDSRAYLVRNGAMRRLTRDHTIIQLLLDAGEITEEDASQHPGKGQLTYYIGMAGSPKPDISSLNLQKGDILLLCSDGLTNMLNEAVILDVTTRSASLDECCDTLVSFANDAGGRDNITVVLAKKND